MLYLAFTHYMGPNWGTITGYSACALFNIVTDLKHSNMCAVYATCKALAWPRGGTLPVDTNTDHEDQASQVFVRVNRHEFHFWAFYLFVSL